MTAIPVLSLAGAEAALNAITVLLNSGPIKIYAGGTTFPKTAPPATTLTASTGATLLSSGCTFGTTAFGAAGANGGAGGVGGSLATANAIASDTNAAATGTATFFRAFKSDGTTVVLQGNCDTSAADMVLNTTSIVAASTVAITAYTVVLPDGTTSD